MKKELCWIAPVMALLLSACAGQVAPKPRSFYDNISKNIDSTSVLIDSCIVREEVGTSHVKGFLSVSISEKMSTLVADFLLNKSAILKIVETPFICANANDDFSKKFTIKMDVDKAGEPINLPIMLDKNNKKEVLSAYLSLYKSVSDAKYEKNPNKKIKEERLLISLSKKDVDTLKQHLLTDKIWMVSTSGSQTSFGKVFNYYLTNVSLGVLTMGLFGSVASNAIINGYSVNNVPHKGTIVSVTLVDLSKQDVLWRNISVDSSDPADMSFYSEELIKKAFDPFYKKDN